MARYSASARTSAGSTTLPIMSLYRTSGVAGKIVEVGVFNTTTTAVCVGLARLTSTGTQGSGITAAEFDPAGAAATMTAKQTHSVGPTISDEICRTTLGAAAGAGIIWTFAPPGLVIPPGADATVGIGIIIPTGTGQICDCYIIWDE